MSVFRTFIHLARNIRLLPSEKIAIGESIRKAVRKADEPRLNVSMQEQRFFDRAQEIRLSASEKAVIREALLSAMKKESAHAWWLLPFKSLTTVTAAFLIVSLSGVGISFAAESAMPGDLLYPVKVHINEEVRSKLAMTPQEKAKVEMMRAERRLVEAEMLAQSSSLDEKTADMLCDRMMASAKSVQEAAHDMMEDHDDADMAATVGMDFEATLVAHGKLLKKIAEAGRGVDVAPVIDVVENIRMDVEETNIVALLKANPEQVIASIRTSSGHDDDRRSASKEQAPAAATMMMFDAATPQIGTDDRAADLREARMALRKMKESKLMKDDESPKSPEVETAGQNVAEEAPPVMMLRAPVPMPEPKHEESSDEDMREDLSFSAKVRMRMTEKKLKNMEEKIEAGSGKVTEERIRTSKERMKDAEELVRKAKKKMEEDDMPAALEASDEALKHADETDEELDDALGL